MAAKYPLTRLDEHPTLTPDLLRLAYREMCLARCHVERVVQECSKGNIKFAIWGPGCFGPTRWPLPIPCSR